MGGLREGLAGAGCQRLQKPEATEANEVWNSGCGEHHSAQKFLGETEAGLSAEEELQGGDLRTQADKG